MALSGPCGWNATLGDRCGCAGAASDEEKEAAVGAAVDWLFEATGRRFGRCPAAARWVRAGGCRPGPTVCGYGRRPGWELDIPDVFDGDPFTVTSVVTVSDGGVPTLLDPGVWFAEAGRLVRRDAVWPAQDPRVPAGAAGTWWVVGEVGDPPPPMLLRAVEDLACEFLRADYDPEACKLPDGVASITRRGVTLTFKDDDNSGLASVRQAVARWGDRAAVFARDPADPLGWRALDPATLPTAP